MIDRTHDPALRSWVESANDPATDFPIQNLPLGVFRPAATADWRIGIAIGDQVLDLAELSERGLLPTPLNGIAPLARARSLNELLELGPSVLRALRVALSDCLQLGTTEGKATLQHAAHLLHPMATVELRLPVTAGDYTDFYASVHHATNVGTMLRPDNPLLPNYKWVPIGYHGRASSLVVSGTPVRRPRGQVKAPNVDVPTFGPSASLDYEAELGFVVGTTNALGAPVPISAAGNHLCGVVLLNDWSARDVQAWEYQPLGPFLSKNFATSLSPWLVTMDALEPFRVPALTRAAEDPKPFPYLYDEPDQTGGALDVRVEVWLRTAAMRNAGLPPVRVSEASAGLLYWTPAQLVAHHTSGGCNLQVGDLIGSGTISGPTRESRGCLLELTWRGNEPISLPSGETRRFLEDGDEVIMRGYCEREGYRRVGLGACVGEVLPVSEQ